MRVNVLDGSIRPALRDGGLTRKIKELGMGDGD